MTTRILTIAALAFGALAIGSGSAMAQRAPSLDTPPALEPCFIRCEPPPFGEPDPTPDPDPIPGPQGPEQRILALGCEVRDDGLVFRNLGDTTVAARTRLRWATTDGRSGRVTLGQSFEPKTAMLYADAPAGAEGQCSLTVI